MNDFVMNRILLRLGKAITKLQSLDDFTPEQIEAITDIDTQYAACVAWFVKSSE